MNIPPPLPPPKIHTTRRNKIPRAILALAIISGVLAASIATLRISGLLNLFIFIPTGSMSPSIAPGDHIVMENLTFLKRKPHRGDIVVFKTTGISSLEPGKIFDKRVLGEPGEHLRISDGKLYINDALVMITNDFGVMDFTLTEQMKPFVHYDDVTIPSGQYFVIGDNINNSMDSRSFGCIPVENIKGRVCFRWWPPDRLGTIK